MPEESTSTGTPEMHGTPFRQYVRLLCPSHSHNLDWWMQWPPDVFALTSMVFKHTGIYIAAVQPPKDLYWPDKDWQSDIKAASEEWIERLVHSQPENIPRYLQDRKKIIETLWKVVTIEDLIALTEPDIDVITPHEVEALKELIKSKRPKLKSKTKKPDELDELDIYIKDKTNRPVCAWALAQCLLELHGLSDETCAGFGTLAGHFWRDNDPLSQTQKKRNQGSQLHFIANSLLAHTGSLSRIPKHVLRVIPKIRTSNVGLTLRSASHYLTVHMSEASIKWRTLPLTNIDEDTINIMIVPYPYEFKPTWFSPSKFTTHRDSPEGTRYFDYVGPNSTEELNVEFIIELLDAAEQEGNRVHIIVLPELSITLANLKEVLTTLADKKDRDKLPWVLAGIRETPNTAAGHDPQLGKNQAVVAAFFAGKWYLTFQNKHHRWKLNEHQIRQYNLGGILAGSKEWWEAINIPRRELSILAPNQWFTLCCLICEDLARQEPIADIIRGIGPTLLIAILLDGPQLEGRWPGRYASVLADDPGSSVLSVTSAGFMQRSTPGNTEANKTTIGMWKDRISGARPIDLPPGKAAVVVTATANWIEEVTLAGRSDKHSGAILVWQGNHALDWPSKYNTQTSKINQRSTRNHSSPEVSIQKFIASDHYDFRELSLFACFVAAAINSDKDGIDALKNLFILAEKDIPFIKKTWPDDLVDILLYEDNLISEANTKSKKRGAARDIVEPYIEWFCELLKNIQNEIVIRDNDLREEGQLGLFVHIVDYTEAILKWVGNDKFSDALNKGDAFATLRKDHPSIPIPNGDNPPYNQRVRIYIYVSLALLWAIHSQLTDMRHTKTLNPSRNILLNRIEDLLKSKHDDKWRKGFT